MIGDRKGVYRGTIAKGTYSFWLDRIEKERKERNVHLFTPLS